MTIYIDLILVENVMMNYIIILTTGIICKEKVKHIRFLIASVLGAIYVVLQYVLNIKIYNNEILKLLLAISMVYLSFKAKNFKILFKHLIIFFVTSFCFGGASYYILHSEMMKGKMLNLNTPLKAVILGGIIGSIILNISFKLYKKKINRSDLIYNIEIEYKRNKKSINVLLDTGNLLKDPLTNIPVVIIEKEKLEQILPKEILNSANSVSKNIVDVTEEIKSRCSIIPFKSIGKNNGIILGFRPDKIIINENNDIKEKKAIIGIYDGKISKSNLYSGLIGLNILEDS